MSLLLCFTTTVLILLLNHFFLVLGVCGGVLESGHVLGLGHWMDFCFGMESCHLSLLLSFPFFKELKC